MLKPGTPLPDPRGARPDGLVAIGGDLSVPRLLEAYRNGIFPWSADPVTWWSPDPRSIIPIDTFHIPRRLSQKLKQQKFRITFDQAFHAVMEGCAASAPGRESSWIEGEMFSAYVELQRCGHAHSVECWQGDTLAGGLYGVCVGGFFAGESMFHRSTDASNIALAALMEHLKQRGFSLFDTQVSTPHTLRLGAIDIPREEYLRLLRDAIELPIKF